MVKSRVLVVGGTGYMGRRIVKASLAEGHPTFVLQRQELGVRDIEKLQMLLAYKEQGAHLVPGSFSDHRSLVEAVKQVDVVICAIAGVPYIRSHHIVLQLKLIDAIKEAGNVKRFLPSEFGIDPSRIGRSMDAGECIFTDKIVVRKAIEDARIPHTYVSASISAGYFLANLCEPGRITPSKERVSLLGDGNVKAIFLDEDDIGTYTIKTIDDPRTLNKTLYLRPPKNILSQREVIGIWEKLIGKELIKMAISNVDFLTMMKGQDIPTQSGLARYYHIFYEGCLTNFDVGGKGEEASKLYPEVNYTHAQDYLKRYL